MIKIKKFLTKIGVLPEKPKNPAVSGTQEQTPSSVKEQTASGTVGVLEKKEHYRKPPKKTPETSHVREGSGSRVTSIIEDNPPSIAHEKLRVFMEKGKVCKYAGNGKQIISIEYPIPSLKDSIFMGFSEGEFFKEFQEFIDKFFEEKFGIKLGWSIEDIAKKKRQKTFYTEGYPIHREVFFLFSDDEGGNIKIEGLAPYNGESKIIPSVSHGKNVKKGDSLAKIEKMEDSYDGIDVKGNPIPRAYIDLGNNIGYKEEQGEEKFVKKTYYVYRATSNGIVHIKKSPSAITYISVENEIRESELNYDIGRDEPYHLGELSIKGNITSGISVRITGNITCDSLLSGKKIESTGGLVHIRKNVDNNIDSMEKLEVAKPNILGRMIYIGSPVHHGEFTGTARIPRNNILSTSAFCMSNTVVGGNIVVRLAEGSFEKVNELEEKILKTKSHILQCVPELNKRIKVIIGGLIRKHGPALIAARNRGTISIFELAEDLKKNNFSKLPLIFQKPYQTQAGLGFLSQYIIDLKKDCVPLYNTLRDYVKNLKKSEAELKILREELDASVLIWLQCELKEGASITFIFGKKQQQFTLNGALSFSEIYMKYTYIPKTDDSEPIEKLEPIDREMARKLLGKFHHTIIMEQKESGKISPEFPDSL